MFLITYRAGFFDKFSIEEIIRLTISTLAHSTTTHTKLIIFIILCPMMFTINCTFVRLHENHHSLFSYFFLKH